MLQLRRSALRVLSSQPSSFLCKPRSISSLSSFSIKSKPPSSALLFQRRWASTEAEAKKDEEEVPISELQPTPEEEVANAIQEDNLNTAEADSASGIALGAGPEGDISAAADEAVVQASSEAIPVSESGEASYDAAAAGYGDTPQRTYSRPDRTPAEPKETVYIGNLFFDVTENDLKKELSRFGNVVSCRLLRDSRGLSKGFGYVDFESIDSATAAINALNQQVFEGRRLTVQYAAFNSRTLTQRRPFDRPERGLNPASKTLFIGNMSYEMTDRDLTNLFRGIRNVIDVRVAIDRRTGQPRGFAHADFLDIKSATDALKVLTEKESYGRKLRIDYSYGSSMAPKNQGPPER